MKKKTGRKRAKTATLSKTKPELAGIGWLTRDDIYDCKRLHDFSMAELKKHKKKLDEILDIACKDVLPDVTDRRLKFHAVVDIDMLEVRITTEVYDDVHCIGGCPGRYASKLESMDMPAEKHDLMLEVFMKYDLLYDLFDGEAESFICESVHLDKKTTGMFQREMTVVGWDYTMKKVDSIEELELELMLAGFMPGKRGRMKNA